MSKNMMNWISDLFPLCRSLTGLGTQKTLSYFEKINPELKRISFKTGEKVFDWEIPKQWNIKDAYIEHENGNRYAEFSKSNLHVVGYSSPIDKIISKNELFRHIYTQADQPDLIPFVASYYENNWGFCISENEKNNLPDGNYRVFINSELVDGVLELSHAFIKGINDKEIFFSSYICHPSMANDNLSGPAVLNAILKFVKEEFDNLRYSYRFVLLPETIGSIAFLSKYSEELKKKLIAGFNLTCVGDERAYSHIKTRAGNTLADNALSAALIDLDNVITYSFLKRGSDERQYCSPGINLPVCGFSRSKYEEFPEYHTSADNLNLITQKGLEGSFSIIKNIILAFEQGLYPQTKVLCEPQLGKRGLYPNIGQKDKYDKIKTRWDFLAYADGKTNIFEIAKLINKPLKEVNDEHQLLKTYGLV